MQRQPGMPSRPPFPYDLVNIDPRGYAQILRESGYGQGAIDQELEKLAAFQSIYQQDKRKTLNAVPLDEPEEKVVKALEKRKNKKSKEAKEEDVQTS